MNRNLSARRMHLKFRNSAAEEIAMDVATWLPALFVLGLAALGLMILFIEACDRV